MNLNNIPQPDLTKLQRLLVGQFEQAELQDLAYNLGVKFDELGGVGLASKTRELIALMERRGRIGELIEIVRQQRPDLDWHIVLQDETINLVSSVGNLDIDLVSLRQQLDEIKREAVTDDELESKIEHALKTANRAIERNEQLTARLILPPSELTDVRLVPAGWLERLEEYRSDENVVYLFIGTFGGAILGILSNWATNDPFIVTRVSIVLMALLAVLTLTCMLWARRIQIRASSMKQQILSTGA